MVRVVETIEPPLEADQVYKFKVYRSPADGKSVFGYIEPHGVVNAGGQTVTWTTMKFGIPVAEAFAQAVALAHEHGIPAIMVIDPDELFPVSERRA